MRIVLIIKNTCYHVPSLRCTGNFGRRACITGVCGMIEDSRANRTHADLVREVAGSRSAAAHSVLAASWTRSLKRYGLLPEQRRGKERLPAGRLCDHRSSLGRLLPISAPVMDRLYASLGLAGCSVLLSDHRGVVVEQRIPASDDQAFQAAGLWRGTVWSEAKEGTNGIGTCIAEESSVTVFRDQHFHDCNTMMSCMGAPVFDEKGRLAAVLDVSSCRADMTRPMAMLVAQAVADGARQIEADHFQAVFAGQRILRGPGDGQNGSVLLAVDQDDLVIGATRAARKAYRLSEESLATPRPVGDLFGDSERRGVGLECAERREVRRAIARADGNMAAAARSLSISRATLYRRLERLGLSRP